MNMKSNENQIMTGEGVSAHVSKKQKWFISFLRSLPLKKS